MTNLTERDLRIGEAKANAKEKFSKAVRKFIEKQPGDLFVTLTFNSGGRSMIDMRRTLSKYLAKLDRRFLHNHFYHAPAERRVDGVFVAEKIDCNAHWHGIMRLPPGRFQSPISYALAIREAKRIWENIAPKGDANFLPITESKSEIAGYISKENFKRDFLDQVAFAAECHPC